MKKWDIIIIISLLILSFAPYGFIKGFARGRANSVYAVITVEGKVYGEIPLTGQRQSKDYWIESSLGSNQLRVEAEGIYMVSTDCRDHLCEKFGTVKKPGEVIVCLPHQLYIELKGTFRGEDEEDIRGY